MRSELRVLIVGGCLLNILSLPLQAKDWPQWGGGPSRNMVSEEHFRPASLNPERQKASALDASPFDVSSKDSVKWSVPLGTHTYGDTVVADGRIYIGTNDDSLEDPRIQKTRGGLILCLEEQTGKLLWQLPIPRFRTSRSNFNYDNLDLGICASVTVDENRAYVVSNRGEVLCLDVQGQANGNDGPFTGEAQFISEKEKPDFSLQPTDGDLIWVYDMNNDLPVQPQDASSSVVLVHGSYLYVGTSNGVDKSHQNVQYPDAPSLIVLDKKTGRLVARDDEKIGHTLFHGQWSSPCLGIVDGRPLIVYGGGDGVCYAFKPYEGSGTGPVVTLEKIWSCDCNPPAYKSHPYQRGKYYSFSSDFYGEGPSEIIGTPVFHDNRVYVSIGQDTRHGRGAGAVTCIDAATGKIVWQSTEVDRGMATPSIVDDLVYVSDYSGYIHCLDAQTGKHLWKAGTESAVWSSTLVADDRIYLGTEKKELWILEASRQKKVFNILRFPDILYNTPVIANGVMYIATERTLYAIGG